MGFTVNNHFSCDAVVSNSDCTTFNIHLISVSINIQIPESTVSFSCKCTGSCGNFCVKCIGSVGDNYSVCIISWVVFDFAVHIQTIVPSVRLCFTINKSYVAKVYKEFVRTLICRIFISIIYSKE